MLLKCAQVNLVIAVAFQKTSGQLKTENETGATLACFLSHYVISLSL